jgi:hypothetical protein
VIPYNSITISNISNFYDMYDLDEDFIAEIEKLISEGFEQEALDMILSEYIIPASEAYSRALIDYLYQMDQGPLREKDIDKLSRNTTLLGLGLIAYLNSAVIRYTEAGYFEQIFARNDIISPTLKKSIINEVLGEFYSLINNTVGQTQNFIMTSIRTLQREMLSENLLLKNSGLKGEALELEITRFKESLRIKYPEIYKAMNNGNVMTVTRFSDGVEKTRHYKIDYYVDLSVRTSLLNAERNANTIAAFVNNEPVMEYYLVDPRQVKKDREICQEILNKKINGLSILALDDNVAKILGIMTIDEAKSTPDYAMGPLCRHGVRRCDKDYIEYINSLIEDKDGN